MAYNTINGFAPKYNAYNIPSAIDGDIGVRPEAANPGAISPDTKGADSRPNEAQQGPFEGPKPIREDIFGESVSLSIGEGTADSSYMAYGGLASDDMKRAISGMQKDSILQEYQYFVGKDLSGKTGNIITSSDDGVVLKLG